MLEKLSVQTNKQTTAQFTGSEQSLTCMLNITNNNYCKVLSECMLIYGHDQVNTR